jgi:uncharacterized protein (TIGR02270 family)
MSNIIPVVVTQHAVEAGVLWQQRHTAAYAPNYLQKDLAHLEDRLEAHLDGLRIAGEAGWEIVAKLLEENTGPGEVFVALYLACETGKQDRIDKVLSLAAPVPALHQGVVSALAWLPAAVSAKQLPGLLYGPTPGWRSLGLGAAVALRANPGLALEKALHDHDLALRARALRMVGEMGYAVWAKQLKQELRSPDAHCRFAAAWSLARLTGDAAALSELQTIVLAESKYRIPALHLLVRRLDVNAARKLIGMLSKIPGAERFVCFAMGVHGDPVDVPYLFDQMKQTPVARVAAEAFAFITGLNLTAENMDGSTPKDHEPLPNEDPLDPRVDTDPDDNLPWPIIEKVQSWWAKHRSRFAEGTRYLVGEPLTETYCNKLVVEGYQRQRGYAALELAIRQPGVPVIDFTTPHK